MAADGRTTEERWAEMRQANPKYILRNSMALEAYEAAAKGDYSVVRELHAVLLRPYEDQGVQVDKRWAQTDCRRLPLIASLIACSGRMRIRGCRWMSAGPN